MSLSADVLRHRCLRLSAVLAVGLAMAGCTPAGPAADLAAESASPAAAATPNRTTDEERVTATVDAPADDLSAASGSPGASEKPVAPPTEEAAPDTEDDPSAAVAPPSGPGDLSVVPVEPQETLPPVEVEKTAEVDDRLSVAVTLGEADVTASRPGEIGGEALQVTVRMINEGSSARDVSTVFVSVDDAEEIPLSPLYGDPYSPIEGELPPDASVEGTYVFTLGGSTEPYTVRVSVAADNPVAVFVGNP